MKGIGVAAAWIGTSVAVIVGMYLTGSTECLWFFTYPISCNYYVDYKSDESLLSLEFEHNI